MWKKVVFGIGLVVSIVAGFGVAKVQSTMNNTLNHVTRDTESVLKDVNLDGIKVNSDDDVINILLIGDDSRKENGQPFGGLADVMMIATMDKKHGTLKLTSLMRDTLVVNAKNDQVVKMNSTYSTGGVKNMYKTIAKNFNIRLDGYALVGFTAFKKVVDQVGGVELELTESELQYLKGTNYINGAKNRKNLKLGKQTMNGAQALGYVRIRADKNRYGVPLLTPNGLTDDYGRTWRQRTVMTAVFEKMKTLSISQLLEVANSVLDNVKTDLDNDTIISYIKDVVMMGTTDVYQLQIPMEGYFRDGHSDEFPNSAGWSLVPTNGVSSTFDTSAIADAMKQFLFEYDGKGEFKYESSSSDSSDSSSDD